MTTSPTPAPDTAPARSYQVSGLETAVKAAVRAAPPAARHPMWAAWLAAADAARSTSPGRLPWESPDEVAAVSLDAAKHILTAVYTAMTASVSDPAERTRIQAVLTSAIAKLERAPDNGAPAAVSRYLARRCAEVSCEVIFVPRYPNARFHADSCRKRHHQAAQRARRDARTSDGTTA